LCLRLVGFFGRRRGGWRSGSLRVDWLVAVGLGWRGSFVLCAPCWWWACCDTTKECSSSRRRSIGIGRSNLQLLCVGVSNAGDSGSSACTFPFTCEAAPPPLSTSPALGPKLGSGLLLGLLPFIGEPGRGTLVAIRYAVTSPSPSSSCASWYCGLGSLLLHPIPLPPLLGDSDVWW